MNNIKEMIRRSITMISPDDDHKELLGKLEANTVKDFSITVGNLMRPEMCITLEGHDPFFWPFPSSSNGLNIAPFLELWGIPGALANCMESIQVEGGGDAVTWSGSGFVSRELLK
jgi:hypothetical protein